MAAPGEAEWRLVSAKVGLRRQLRDIWTYREFLILSVRTQLRLKYRNSTLGFVWSMLNPALYLVVFYIVFQLILENGIPSFAIFLLSGLLVWNLFSTAIAGATGSIVGGGALIKKVTFPREILPLSAVGAAVVHFFLQSVVLVLALLLFRYAVGWEYLVLIPFALVALILLSGALGLWLSAVNVKLRDTMHMVELALLAWFWMTPIVYPFMLIQDKGGIAAALYKLNPIVWIVLTFQRAIYNQAEPQSAVTGSKPTDVIHILPADAGFWYYAWHLAVVGGIATVLFLLAMAYFGRVEGNFSEEL
jgi:ABC-2 type transport system permease protein